MSEVDRIILSLSEETRKHIMTELRKLYIMEGGSNSNENQTD